MVKSDLNQDIGDQFSQLQSKSEIAEVLKELFDTKKIKLITDLSPDEIKLCTRIFTISDLKNIPVWKKGLNFYLTLSLSKNRKSRRELIDAVRGHAEQRQGIFSKMNPMNWGR